VRDLPGAPAGIDFKMFSGYVTLGDEDRHMFYWLATSSGPEPANAPLVLWTNGGPGCSGLGGFMTEQGPFRPSSPTQLQLNPNAWNKVANMIFIEQPVGVGFSYFDGASPDYGDSQAAKDNYLFLKGFLEKFPQFANNQLYITSESYGGHYMPTLAKEIVDAGDLPNFKGFMVGNPLTYMPYRNYGETGTYWNHQLLPKPLWDKYVANQCETTDSSVCSNIMSEAEGYLADMDPYALDFPVCSQKSLATGRHERHTLLSHIRRSGSLVDRRHVKGYFPADYQPCDANWATMYLNQKSVQEAIHVRNPGSIRWGECSNINYNMTDVVAPMMPIYKYLIDKQLGLNIMIYSGDDDSVCATLGSQQFIWDLGYENDEKWAQWKLDGQVAGYTTHFRGRGNNGFRFTTVHGAGHMVPATRPAQSLQVFKNFLSGKW